MQKKHVLLLTLLLFVFNSFGQNKNSVYNSYIEKFSSVAVIHQQKYGIPASITLAQALLESNAGQSELTARSNNHFGIKCNDWTGETVYHNDDNTRECFRKYNTAMESYEDRALFLKNRSRYADLFKLDQTDYKAWAKGLLAAGYATDKKYADKLIKVINDYELNKYDVAKNHASILKKAGLEGKSENLTSPPIGIIDAWNRHIVYDNNGVDCIVVREGDTYGSIADEFDIFEKKLRKYNDDLHGNQLRVGKALYLKAKKNKADKDNQTYTVKAGDTMHAISQKFAIKVEKLYKLNNMDFKDGAKVGQQLKLR